jgi:hypothetical protein
MQRELVAQRITQFGVVINDQDLARVRHSFENPFEESGKRQIEKPSGGNHEASDKAKDE